MNIYESKLNNFAGVYESNKNKLILRYDREQFPKVILNDMYVIMLWYQQAIISAWEKTAALGRPGCNICTYM